MNTNDPNLPQSHVPVHAVGASRVEPDATRIDPVERAMARPDAPNAAPDALTGPTIDVEAVTAPAITSTSVSTATVVGGTAMQHAAHDAAIADAAHQRQETYHDAAHPAVTGTGIGDNRDETNDSVAGATIGGVGGAIVGAAAGAMLGPVGSIAGAVVGALTGAGAAGLAVDAVDRVDDDNTVSGLNPADDTKNNTPSPLV